MLLSLAQDRLLRLASYRREWGSEGGVSLMRLSPGEHRTAQALVNGLLAVAIDGRLYSITKTGVPRPAWTYRGARRNAARDLHWPARYRWRNIVRAIRAKAEAMLKAKGAVPA